MKLEPGQRFHFVGIGGVGMSAIAKVLIERGHEVSGSDLKPSHATVSLEAMGARVNIGHDGSAVRGADVVVTSSAIPRSNSEVARAEELGIPVVGRGHALAAVLGDLRSVVVAGTHGKTTTTSMIVSVLSGAGLDPTYLVGGGLNDVGTNARFGRGPLAVAESDESDGSFLLLRPHVAVVTNIEADHLDYWGSLEAVRDGFRRFLTGVQPDGAVIVPVEEPELAGHVGDRRVITFGPGGDVSSEDVTLAYEGARFTLVAGERRAPVTLRVAGRHNVSNALACAAACLEAGVSLPEVARYLGGFRGVERRFQVRGRARGVTVIDTRPRCAPTWRPRARARGSAWLPCSSRTAIRARPPSRPNSGARSSARTGSSSPTSTERASNRCRESAASWLPTRYARRCPGARSPTCRGEPRCWPTSRPVFVPATRC